MVTCLNNPPGKKVVARVLRRSSLVVTRLVQVRLKPSLVQFLAHVFVYSFGSNPP